MEQVENYNIRKSNSGIVKLLINTKEKWPDYHRYNNLEYLINEEMLILKPEELQLEPIQYICTQLQVKDQIGFYYIPFTLLK